MTKKHFEAIAAILLSMPGCKTKEDYRHYNDLCGKFADLFQSENPRFDRARFLEACGATS